MRDRLVDSGATQIHSGSCLSTLGDSLPNSSTSMNKTDPASSIVFPVRAGCLLFCISLSASTSYFSGQITTWKMSYPYQVMILSLSIGVVPVFGVRFGGERIVI